MSVLKKLYPAFILSVICLCCALLLAGTYALTKDRIADQEAQSALFQKQSIFPQSEDFIPIDIPLVHIEVMREGGFAPKEVYEARDALGQIIGYIVIADAFGYAGPITVIAGFSPDAQVVRVTATANNETPDLGQDVEKDFFLSQFEDIEPFSPALTEGDANKVELLSGATLSSQATVDAFNIAVRAFSYLSEEGAL